MDKDSVNPLIRGSYREMNFYCLWDIFVEMEKVKEIKEDLVEILKKSGLRRNFFDIAILKRDDTLVKVFYLDKQKIRVELYISNRERGYEIERVIQKKIFSRGLFYLKERVRLEDYLKV